MKIRFKPSRKLAVAIVVVVIVIGASFFAILTSHGHNPYPGLVTDNKVVNGTVAANFANYSSISPFNATFGAVTDITYHNMSSNFALNVFVYVFFVPSEDEVVADIHFNVSGNVSSTLLPTGVPTTVTNNWSNSLGFSNVIGWNAAGNPPPLPYSNVSAPAINSMAGAPGSTFQVKASLLNQTNNGGANRFWYVTWMAYRYNTLSYFTSNPTGTDIGKQVLHFTASLQGLGQLVFVSVNVLLMNKN